MNKDQDVSNLDAVRVGVGFIAILLGGAFLFDPTIPDRWVKVGISAIVLLACIAPARNRGAIAAGIVLFALFRLLVALVLSPGLFR